MSHNLYVIANSDKCHKRIFLFVGQRRLSVLNQLKSQGGEASPQAESSLRKALVISRVKAAKSGNISEGIVRRETHKGLLGALDLFGHTDRLAGDLGLNSMDMQHTLQMWALVGLTWTHQQTPV